MYVCLAIACQKHQLIQKVTFILKIPVFINLKRQKDSFQIFFPLFFPFLTLSVCKFAKHHRNGELSAELSPFQGWVKIIEALDLEIEIPTVNFSATKCS